MMTALGFIETLGLLPAVEAADAMLKAAEVRLEDKSLASGGLVTITVSGEVAAVKAAVDAAAAAVGRIPGARLVSRHVIARPDDELKKIIAANSAAQKETAAPPAARPQPAPQAAEPAAPIVAEPAAPAAAAPAPKKPAKKAGTSKKKR